MMTVYLLLAVWMAWAVPAAASLAGETPVSLAARGSDQEATLSQQTVGGRDMRVERVFDLRRAVEQPDSGWMRSTVVLRSETRHFVLREGLGPPIGTKGFVAPGLLPVHDLPSNPLVAAPAEILTSSARPISTILTSST